MFIYILTNTDDILITNKRIIKMEQFNEKQFNMSNIGEVKERAGFVTFWLWLGIFVLSILSIILVYNIYGQISQLKSVEWLLSSYYHDVYYTALYAQYIAMALTIILGVGGIIGYVKLLNYKKSGFKIFVSISILNVLIIIANTYFTASFSESLSGDVSSDLFIKSAFYQIAPVVVGLLVLWGVLQIKKNGKSCWSQLD